MLVELSERDVQRIKEMVDDQLEFNKSARKGWDPEDPEEAALIVDSVSDDNHLSALLIKLTSKE